MVSHQLYTGVQGRFLGCPQEWRGREGEMERGERDLTDTREREGEREGEGEER